MRATILRTEAGMDMLRTVWPEIGALATVMTSPGDDERTLAKLIVDADLLIMCYAAITRPVVAAAKHLKGILKYGVGVDSIDIEAATEFGVPVYNCPHYGTGAVADHAFALLIALARRLLPIHAQMRKTGWMWPDPVWRGTDLTGKTVGIIGLGRIGRSLARRCEGFDMRVLAYDPYVTDASGPLGIVALTDLDTLLKRSDFISIHAVLTAQTRGLIGEPEFGKMKPSAYLINVSRAAIVNEAALIRALTEGRIAGAGLDVFHREPLSPDHPFFALNNILMTPHFAYLTREAEHRLDRETLDSASVILNGGRPANVINPEAFGRARSG
jgi:D-3-phosphoglycerate dehydrogenase / 2-oxoglutarate reductase